MPEAAGFAELLAEAEALLGDEDAEAALAKASSALSQASGSGAAAAATRLMMQAEAHLGREDEAAQKAKVELAKSRQAGDRLGEATILLAMAELDSCDLGGSKLEAATESAQQARELFEELVNAQPKAKEVKRLAGHAMLVLCNLSTQKGDCRVGDVQKSYQRALELARQALEFFQQAGDQKGQATATHAIAANRMNMNNIESGVRAAKEALRLWQGLDVPRSEVFELQSLATWYVKAGSAGQALPFAEEALQVAREANCGATWEASALSTIVQVLCAAGQPDRALQAAMDGVAQFRQSGEKPAEVVALDVLVGASMARGDPFEALKVAQKVLEAYDSLDLKRQKAAALRSVAQVQLQTGQMAEALKSAKESLQILQDLEDFRHQRPLTFDVISMAHIANQQVKEAIDLAEEERDFYSGAEDQRREAVLLLSMVSLHVENKAFQEAIWATEDAQANFEDIEDKAGEAICLQMCAQVQMMDKKYAEAIAAGDKALPLLREAGDQRGEVGTLLLSAQAECILITSDTKLETSDPAFIQGAFKAVKTASLAIAVARRIGDETLVAAGLCMLAQCYYVAWKGEDVVQAASGAVTIYRGLGDRSGEAYALVLSAKGLLAVGKEDKSKEAASKALLSFRQLGDKQGEALAEGVIDIIENPPESEEPQHQQLLPMAALGQSMVYSMVGTMKTLVSVADLANKVRGTVMDIIGVDHIQDDTPLMQTGLTSQSAVLLRNSLTKEMGGTSLPFTMMFDYPSVAALTEYFVDRAQN